MIEAATDRLPFSIHDRFHFFKVTKFDLQLPHLRLNKKRNKTLDLSFLHRSHALPNNKQIAVTKFASNNLPSIIYQLQFTSYNLPNTFSTIYQLQFTG